MKKIPLTQGKFALVDDGDFEWLSQWKWYALQNRHTFYAVRAIYMNKDRRKIELMHRTILGLQRDDKWQADHRDGNGLNNQGANLRTCTTNQNLQSQRKWTVGTSRYKGVSWHRGHHKWQSRICVDGKAVLLGYFLSEKLAAETYNQAALKAFGEFALPNVI